MNVEIFAPYGMQFSAQCRVLQAWVVRGIKLDLTMQTYETFCQALCGDVKLENYEMVLGDGTVLTPENFNLHRRKIRHIYIYQKGNRSML